MRISGSWRISCDPGSKRDPVSIMIEGKGLYRVPEIVLRPPQVAVTYGGVHTHVAHHEHTNLTCT